MSGWWWAAIALFTQITATVLYRAAQEAIAQWDDLHEYEEDEPV